MTTAPRALQPSDIKDSQGHPLTETKLRWLWLYSKALNRQVTALDLLSISPTQTKLLYDEASEELSRLNSLCNSLPQHSPQWRDADAARAKARKFYKVAQQTYHQRREQAGIPRQSPVEFIVNKLTRQAAAEGWPDNLLHLRITDAISSLIPASHDHRP